MTDRAQGRASFEKESLRVAAGSPLALEMHVLFPLLFIILM